MADWRWGRWGFVLLVGAVGYASAQTGPSPVDADDLTRPVFDTAKPAYDTADQRDKSASAIIAEVDGRAVTLGDVGDAIADMPASAQNLPFADLYPKVVSQLIRRQALVIRAQRHGLDEDVVVRRKIKNAMERLLASSLLEEEAARQITEAALLERYAREVAGKPGPEEVHVRVIMSPTEDEAQAVIKTLRGGAEFAAVARRSSKDTTAGAGGDAGFVRRNSLTPEIRAVVFSMQPGQMTAFPVRSGAAWFVLRVEERRRLPAPPFAAVREELRQAMLREVGVDIVATALRDVTVREYDITGKEAEAAEQSPDIAQ